MNKANEILNQTIEAYKQGKSGADMPTGRNIPEGMRPLELAALGYKLSDREAETKRRPAKDRLDSVLTRLPDAYIDLVKSPPTKEEAKFLTRDMQTLMSELEQANKGLGAIPNMERTIRNVESQMSQAIVDQEPDQYNNLKVSLEKEKRTLGNIQRFVNDTLRAATAYHQNNPMDIEKSKKVLSVLRTELSAPYSYSEAKDALPTHTKPVVQWLDDFKNKPSSDDRILAQKVLQAGNVDYQGMLTEVDRQGLSLTDKAVLEMRDRESGKTSPTVDKAAVSNTTTSPTTGNVATSNSGEG